MAPSLTSSSARLTALLVLGAGLLLAAVLTRLLAASQSCGCEQSYMYSSYSPVPLLDPGWAGHRYRLVLYREMANPRQGE
jgi:hypothetical protein